MIATIDTPGPQSSVAVAIKAGSRFEPANAPGVSHYFKNFAFKVSLFYSEINSQKDTGDGTGLRTTREAEFMGNQLYTAMGREYVIYGADFLRDNLFVS